MVIEVIMINVNTTESLRTYSNTISGNNYLESVVKINEQLCALLKLSQIMLLSFLCTPLHTLFSLVLKSEFCVNKPYLYTRKTKEELSNNQNCQKSIPKPYYKRKQRPRNITSLKGSIT